MTTIISSARRRQLPAPRALLDLKKQQEMRKILLAFDGISYSESALQFALHLHEKNRVMLVGAFLPQTSLSSVWSYAHGETNLSHGGVPLVEEDTQDTILKNIKSFETYCVDNDMDFRVHKNYFGLAMPALKKESRFADLVILCSQTFFSNNGYETNGYLETMLHDIECPVVILPENFEFPANNVLAYDGEASSVYAIKQFHYLLPELAGNPTTVVYAKSAPGKPIPDKLNLEELVARHHANYSMLHYVPDPKEPFANWLTSKKATILVCGSFGGSDLHRWFHKSFAAGVISKHETPLFIAHK